MTLGPGFDSLLKGAYFIMTLVKFEYRISKLETNSKFSPCGILRRRAAVRRHSTGVQMTKTKDKNLPVKVNMFFMFRIFVIRDCFEFRASARPGATAFKSNS
jgi:hypothetical protein